MPDTLFYRSWKDADPAAWRSRWPNFNPKEISSRDTGELLVDCEALDQLQALRDHLGQPLLVTSAYRTPAYNAKVGGAKNSMHLQGRAFDVSIQNHDPVQLEAAAKAYGFSGIGRYPRDHFIHIDTGPARWWGAPEWPAALAGGFPEEPRQAVQATKAAALAKGGAILTTAGGLGTALTSVDVEDVAHKIGLFQGALPVLEWLIGHWWLPVGVLAVGACAAFVVPRLLGKTVDEKARGFVPEERAVRDGNS